MGFCQKKKKREEKNTFVDALAQGSPSTEFLECSIFKSFKSKQSYQMWKILVRNNRADYWIAQGRFIKDHCSFYQINCLLDGYGFREKNQINSLL